MEYMIRSASTQDACYLVEIYRPYVENTAVTYEYIAPDEKEFAARIEKTLMKYPYLVAEADGEIIGYAYAGAFKNRKAYDRSVETSIYVKEGLHSLGVGRALYNALEKELISLGVTNMYACIAYPEEEDEYLNFNSRYFYEKMGFRLVGAFNKCAYKFGRWYGMIWMEKFIAEHL